MRRFSSWSQGAVLAAVLCSPGLAWAQGRLGDDRPTRGTDLPWFHPLGTPNAGLVELGPAGLGFLRGWEVLVAHTEMDGEGRRPGTGTAAFFAQPVPWLPLAWGAGLQYLRWPDTFGPGYGDALKFTLAASWRPAWWLALGASWSHFWALRGGLEGLDTFDVSLLVRPLSFLAWHVAVRDLAMPRWYGDLPLQRTWDLDLAFRPTATDRLTVTLGVSVGERRATADPRVRVDARVWRSIRFGLEASYRHRFLDLDGDGYEERQLDDFRFTLFYRGAFGRQEVGASVALGTPADGLPGGVFQGAGGMVRYVRRPDRHVLGYENLVVVVPVRSGSEAGFSRMLLALLELARSPLVRAVVFKIADQGVDWARAEGLHRAMARLRRRGIKTVALVHSPGNRAYYAALGADEIWMSPSGTLLIRGLSATRFYFARMLARLGVKVEVLRNGPYKTAPNALVSDRPSREEEQVVSGLLKGYFRRFLAKMAARKGVGSLQAARAALSEAPLLARRALRRGLVDRVLHGDQVERRLGRILPGGRPRLVGLKEALRRTRDEDVWGRRRGVAVIVVEGDLVSGKSRRIPILGKRLCGHESVLKLLDRARRDGRIGSVVLRIRSPGGLAVAADAIWRAVMQLRKVKPVLVSVGRIAASGGYEIASAGDRIFCLPGSLVGSIGMFVAKPVVVDLLRKLGIGLGRWEVGPHAGIQSPYKGLSPAERRHLAARLQAHYRRFLEAVAKGRRRPVGKIERGAGGRVWQCGDGIGLGLADRLGGLAEAVVEARRLAGLGQDAPVLVWPRAKRGLVDRLLRRLVGLRAEEAPPLLRRALEAAAPSFLVLERPEVLARLPYELRIE